MVQSHRAHLLNYNKIKEAKQTEAKQTLINRSLGHNVKSSRKIEANLLQGRLVAREMRVPGGAFRSLSWRSQERFTREGVGRPDVRQDRKPSLPPLPPALVDRIVELTLTNRQAGRRIWTRPGDGHGHRCARAANPIGAPPPAARVRRFQTADKPGRT